MAYMRFDQDHKSVDAGAWRFDLIIWPRQYWCKFVSDRYRLWQLQFGPIHVSFDHR